MGLPLLGVGVVEEQGDGSPGAKDVGDGVVHVGRGDAGGGHAADRVQRLGDDAAGVADQGDLARALQLDGRGGRLAVEPRAAAPAADAPLTLAARWEDVLHVSACSSGRCSCA